MAVTIYYEEDVNPKIIQGKKIAICLLYNLTLPTICSV